MVPVALAAVVIVVDVAEIADLAAVIAVVVPVALVVTVVRIAAEIVEIVARADPSAVMAKRVVVVPIAVLVDRVLSADRITRRVLARDRERNKVALRTARMDPVLLVRTIAVAIKVARPNVAMANRRVDLVRLRRPRAKRVWGKR